MSGGGSLRHKPIVFVTATFVFLSTLAVIPTPTHALSGEVTIKQTQMFTITYANISGSDFIWWDWEVVGKKVNMTFSIYLYKWITVDESGNINAPNNKIHRESSSGSSGQVRLQDYYGYAIVKWNPIGFENTTFRYHVKLRMSDFTLNYIVVGVLFLLPPVVLLSSIWYDRYRKVKIESVKQ